MKVEFKFGNTISKGDLFNLQTFLIANGKVEKDKEIHIIFDNNIKNVNLEDVIRVFVNYAISSIYVFVFSDRRIHLSYPENRSVNVTITDRKSEFEYHFIFKPIDSFCGGYQINTGQYSGMKFDGYSLLEDGINFALRFILCRYEGKLSYSKWREYPIFFYDRSDEYNRIHKYLNPAKTQVLNEYINPNTGNKVAVYKYLIGQ